MNEQTGNLNGTLVRQCIGALKRRHPNLSSRQIAERAGMSQSTFNRLENGGAESATLNTVVKLMSALGQTKKIPEMVEAIVGGGRGFAGKTRDNLSHNLDASVLAGHLTEHLKDPDHRMVLLLAASREGTTREEVRREHGEAGLKALDAMLRSGALEAAPGGAIKERLLKDAPFTTDQDVLKDVLVHCVKAKYDPERYGTGENWLSFQTESVDLGKAMGLIRRKLRQAYKEIEGVLRSGEYSGKDKVFVGMAADSLLRTSETNEKEEVMQ